MATAGRSSPCAFTATWNGGAHASDLKLALLDEYAEFSRFAASHFAFGILTFHLTYLFRTEPGWNLFASGALNGPKTASRR